MKALSSVSVAHHRLALEVSPHAFRRVALAAVGVLVLIVATGATVRLTGSGLGCPHWPTCTTQHALPRGYHSDIEFSNRVVSAVTVLTTLALALAAWRTSGLGRRGRWLATAVFVGTLAQAPLGAITVYYDLNPYLVITHLLLSFTLVSLAVLTLLEASRLVRGGGTPLPAIARLGGLVLVTAVAVLAVSGTAATAAGRFPGSSGAKVVPRLGHFYPAVYWHVRAVAAFGIVFLALAAALTGAGRVCGTSARSEPSVTTSSIPRSCASSRTSPEYVFQRRLGSTPSRITASWSRPGIGAWRNVFSGHSSFRVSPSSRETCGRTAWKS